MSQYAELPDGSYAEFPDDWTPLQMDTALRRDVPSLANAPKPQVLAPPQEGTYAQNNANYDDLPPMRPERAYAAGAEGFVPDVEQTPDTKDMVPAGEFIANAAKQGGANLLGLFLDNPLFGGMSDAASKVAAAAMYPDQPAPDTPSTQSQLEAMLDVKKDISTPSAAGRLAGRAVEYGIGGLPFAPAGPAAYAVSTLGGALGDVAQEDITGERGLTGPIVGALATPPALVSAVSGAGKAVAEGGRKLLTRTGRDELKHLWDDTGKTIDAGMDDLAQSRAAQQIAGAIDSYPHAPETIEAFDQYLTTIERLTGTRPKISLGDALQHPELLKRERLFAGKDPASLNAYLRNEQEAMDTLQQAERAVLGESDPSTLLGPLTRSIDEQSAALSQKVDEATARLEETLAPLRPRVDLAATGAQTRNLIDADRQAVKGRFDNAFSQLREDGADALYDMGPVVAQVDELAKDIAGQLDSTNHPAILRNLSDLKKRWAGDAAEPSMLVDEMGRPMARGGQLLDKSGKPLLPEGESGYQANLEDVWKTVSELTSDIADLQTRVGAKPDVIRKLSGVVDTLLDDVLVKGAKSPLSEQMAARLKDLRTQYRMDYIDRFKIGQTKELGLKTLTGERLVRNEDVILDYLSSDTNMGRLEAAAKDSPEVWNLLDDSVLTLYAGRVSPNNSPFSKRAHDRFMEEFGPQLQKYRPELYQRLQTTGLTADDAARAIKTAVAEQKKLHGSALARRLGNEDVKSVLTGALAHPPQMREVMSRLRPEEMPALRSAALNHVLSSRGNGSYLDALTNKETQRSLKVLLGSDYDKTMGELKAVGAVWDVLRARETPELAATVLNEGRVKALMRKYGVPYIQVASALRAVGRRPESGGWFATIGAGQISNAIIEQKLAANADELQRMIMADPKARESLLRAWKEKDFGQLDKGGGVVNMLRRFGQSAGQGVLVRGGVIATGAETEE